MDSKCPCYRCKGFCNKCPPPVNPGFFNNGGVDRQISTKMKIAQMLKIKGIFKPGNRHTPNLPGTKRPVHPKPPGNYTWPCEEEVFIKIK